MKKDEFEHPLTGETHGEFTWCLHCEQAYKTEFWVKNGWDCPKKKCNGDIVDAFSWHPDHWPMSVNPDYPLIPVEGTYYPLYGEKNRG